MIECSCDYDGGDSCGISESFREETREYHTCSECGDTIWPWTNHKVGLWWDCDSCDHWEGCEGGIDGYCEHDREPDSEDRMCPTCEAACKSLLCGVWYFGTVWEMIAEQNDMTRAECLG